jgi:hypothetical protein
MEVNNPRWSPDDDIDKLKAIYCLYHLEILGYNPHWIPLGVEKTWLIDQLKAFDWYTNASGIREAILKEPKPKPKKRVVKQKPKSPFQDETK